MFRKALGRICTLNGKALTTRKKTLVGFYTRGPILGSKIWTQKWSPPGATFLEPARFPNTALVSQQGFIGML